MKAVGEGKGSLTVLVQRVLRMRLPKRKFKGNKQHGKGKMLSKISHWRAPKLTLDMAQYAASDAAAALDVFEALGGVTQTRDGAQISFSKEKESQAVGSQDVEDETGDKIHTSKGRYRGKVRRGPSTHGSKFLQDLGWSDDEVEELQGAAPDEEQDVRKTHREISSRDEEALRERSDSREEIQLDVSDEEVDIEWKEEMPWRGPRARGDASFDEKNFLDEADDFEWDDDASPGRPAVHTATVPRRGHVRKQGNKVELGYDVLQRGPDARNARALSGRRLLEELADDTPWRGSRVLDEVVGPDESEWEDDVLRKGFNSRDRGRSRDADDDLAWLGAMRQGQDVKRSEKASSVGHLLREDEDIDGSSFIARKDSNVRSGKASKGLRTASNEEVPSKESLKGGNSKQRVAKKRFEVRRKGVGKGPSTKDLVDLM